MNEEIHQADWTIPYPRTLDETTVPTVLRRLTDVEHVWEAFPWYLLRRLVELLEKPEACFEYFHVTTYFRARAAMLALNGDVLDRTRLFAVMREHQVQAGGIYRYHLLHFLRAFLKTHNFRELPECHGHRLDTVHDPEHLEKNRGIIRRVVECAERDYVGTLNFLCVATEMQEEVARHSVGYWVDGGEKPGRLDVGVSAHRHEHGYDVLPAPDEAKALIRAGRAGGKVVVRVAGSADRKVGGRGERGPKTGTRSQHGAQGRPTPCASLGEAAGRRPIDTRANSKDEEATATAAKQAAEIVLAAVAPALRCSKLNPDRCATDDLVQAYTLERKRHATDGQTFTALARLDIEMARRTPDKAPWMRMSEANRHYTRAVRGESIRANDIALRADALERRYRRAIRNAQRSGTMP